MRSSGRPKTPLERALAAAASVALLGPVGCGEAPLDDLEASRENPPADLVVDAGASVPSPPGTASFDVGIRVVPLGACDPGQPDWAECCQRIGWDPQRGCGAWGPPAPPAMPEGWA